ncbi:MAG: hypothetical protein ACXWZT_12265, partial [Gaiellaceae bacterium]
RAYVGSENPSFESERIRVMANPALQMNLPPVAAERRFLAVVHESRENYVQCTAETAECTCPEFCERDHDRD